MTFLVFVFFRPQFWFKMAEISKNVEMCSVVLYLLQQKNTFFQKRPMLLFFVWSSSKTLPNLIFRFPTLFQSGRKSLKPKCSGSCWNQLVGATNITNLKRQQRPLTQDCALPSLRLHAACHTDFCLGQG